MTCITFRFESDSLGSDSSLHSCSAAHFLGCCQAVGWIPVASCYLSLCFGNRCYVKDHSTAFKAADLAVQMSSMPGIAGEIGRREEWRESLKVSCIRGRCV